jgi:hypothetical protein
LTEVAPSLPIERPPVTISLAFDRYVRRDGRWLCTYRRFEHLFESDVPVINPNLDEDK